MLRDILTNAELGVWPVVSLIIMVIAFTAILVWTFAGKKNRFEDESNLPLQEDDEETTNSHSTRGLSS